MGLAWIFHKLVDSNSFKMYRNDELDLIIERDGEIFNATNLLIEDAIYEAYLYLESRRLAKDLVRNAKITL